MEKHVEKSSRNFLRRCKKRGEAGQTNERTDGRTKVSRGRETWEIYEGRVGKFRGHYRATGADGGGGRGETRVRKLYFDSFYEVTDIR